VYSRYVAFDIGVLKVRVLRCR